MTNLVTVFSVLLAVLCHSVLAFWRMPCSVFPDVLCLDPIVSPGKVSAHGHLLAGSQGLSLNATYGALVAAPDTSCAVEQDRSGYWYVSLLFSLPSLIWCIDRTPWDEIL